MRIMSIQNTYSHFCSNSKLNIGNSNSNELSRAKRNVELAQQQFDRIDHEYQIMNSSFNAVKNELLLLKEQRDMSIMALERARTEYNRLNTVV